MDWSKILMGLALVDNRVRQAIFWLQKHVDNYEVYISDDTVVIKINCDSIESASLVAQYISSLLRTLLPGKERSRIRVKP